MAERILVVKDEDRVVFIFSTLLEQER